MNDNPLVSLCVPVFNVEQYIERCAISLFTQSYSNIECIFVDDCSTDRSMQILNRVAAEHPDIRVSVVRHDYNRGIAAARNTLIDVASGDFIMTLDSDDWLETDAVELLVKKQLETNADIVSGNAIIHYPDRLEYMIEPDYADKDEMIRDAIQLTLNHVLWRRLIRTSLYRDNDIHFVEGVDVGDDHYTLPRLVYYSGTCAKVDEVVYHYNKMNNISCTMPQSNDGQLKRYINDVQSIHILERFFDCKNESYVEELRKIENDYIITTLNESARNGNSCLYKNVTAGITASLPPYWISRGVAIVCKVIRRLTGIRFEPLSCLMPRKSNIKADRPTESSFPERRDPWME